MLTEPKSALILAAGENARLKTIVPAHLKPLMLVNGRPLIQHALRHADEWHADHKVVVASPDNVGLLTQVVHENVDWVVQAQPTGVVNAIWRGLKMVKQAWTVILCSDNTFKFQDSPLSKTTDLDTHSLFGARQLPLHDAHRFTRYVAGDHGVRLIEASAEEQVHGCWIGPLLLSTEALRRAFAHDPAPMTIVELINLSTEHGQLLRPIDMLCEDFGVPTEFQGGKEMHT